MTIKLMKSSQFKSLRFFIYAFIFMVSSYRLNTVHDLVPGEFGFPIFLAYMIVFVGLISAAVYSLYDGIMNDY